MRTGRFVEVVVSVSAIGSLKRWSSEMHGNECDSGPGDGRRMRTADTG